MVRDFSDEQISIAIKVVTVLIIGLILWLGFSLIYNNYFRKDPKTETAIEQAFRLVKEKPRNIQYRIAYANMLLVNNRLDEAIDNYKEALKLDDRSEPTLLGLGVAYEKNDQADKAIEAFNKEIKVGTSKNNTAINKYLEQAYFYNGQILLNKGSYKEAAQMLQKAIEIMPTMSDTYFYLGKAKVKLGQKEEAKAAFKKALKLNTNSADAKEELKKLGN